MDAKAKVVNAGLQACVQHGNSWLAIQTASGRLVHTVPVEIASAVKRTLTDHEAELAELQKCFDFANSVILRQDSEIEDAHQKHKTLITGLEALAGEMHKQMSYVEGGLEGSWFKWQHDTYAYIESELRTLASSATGEKNTEEETKS